MNQTVMRRVVIVFTLSCVTPWKCHVTTRAHCTKTNNQITANNRIILCTSVDEGRLADDYERWERKIVDKASAMFTKND
jgi:hypothetical protein